MNSLTRRVPIASLAATGTAPGSGVGSAANGGACTATSAVSDRGGETPGSGALEARSVPADFTGFRRRTRNRRGDGSRGRLKICRLRSRLDPRRPDRCGGG